MTQTCECYKKTTHQEFCTQFENEQIEELNENRTSLLHLREKAVKLPGEIKINDSAAAYPDARTSNFLHLFPQMAEIITGVQDYEYNILSFWILDAFLEGLRTAQLSEMSHRNQKAALHWMVYVYNMLQGSGSKWTRRNIFLKIKLLLLLPSDGNAEDDASSDSEERTDPQENAGKIQWKVPFPPEWRDESNLISSEAEEETKLATEDVDVMTETEHELHDMQIILEIIYRTYARLWCFFLLKTSLRSTPNVNTLDLPVRLNVPKQMLKSESVARTKSARSNGKISARASDDKCVDGESAELKTSDHILPLKEAQGVDIVLRQLFDLPSRDSIGSERDKGKQEKKKKKK